jgi:hypothetical protein
MPSDEDRFRFLDRYRLSLTWSNDGVSIFWRGQDQPGMPGGFYPIARGKTLGEATDAAIERWERKHGRKFN